MNRTTRTLAAVLLALPLVAPPASAQQETRETLPDVRQTQFALDISFPGGTLREYVEAIRAAAPDLSLNVLLRNQAAELEIPPMELRSVSIRAALELALPHRGTRTEIGPDGARVDHFRDLEQVGGDGMTAPVFVIDAIDTVHEPQRAAGATPPARIEVFSLDPRETQKGRISSLLSAFDAALELGDGEGFRPEIKYHADSALLIVRATASQLATIKSVLVEFRNGQSARSLAAREEAARLADLKAELIERHADVQRTQVKLSTKLTELEQLKALAEKDIYNPRQILDAEAGVRLCESELEAAQARYQAAQEQLAMFEGSLERPDMETHELRLRGGPLLLRRAVESLKAIDGISGHIQRVEAGEVITDRASPEGRITVRIRADEEGARVVRMLADSGLAGVKLDAGD